MYYAEKSLILNAEAQNSEKYIVKITIIKHCEGITNISYVFGSNTTLGADRDRRFESEPSEKLSPKIGVYNQLLSSTY